MQTKLLDAQRRVDLELRESINHLQALLFDPKTKDRISHSLLEEVIKVSNADFGICIEINKGFACHRAQSTHLSASDNSQNTIKGTDAVNVAGIAELIESHRISYRPAIYNDFIPDDFKKLFSGFDTSQAMLLVPLMHETRIFSLIIAFRRFGNFDRSLQRRVALLSSAASCAMDSSCRYSSFPFQLEHNNPDNSFLTSLVLSSPTAIITVNEEHKIISANPSASKMFAAEMSLMGSDVRVIIPHYDGIFQWSNQASNKEKKLRKYSEGFFKEEQVGRKINGEEFVIRLSVFRYSDRGSRFTTLQMLDITPSSNGISEYRQSLQQFQALTHLLPLGIIHIDNNWDCIYANDTWYQLSGLNADETAGNGWINAISPGDVNNLLQDLRAQISQGGQYETECRLSSPLGASKWVEFTARSLFGEDGAMLGFLATLADITERLEIQEKLRQVAEFDGLTKLPNRNLFQDRLEQAYRHAERENTDISLLFLDLDGFKDVNDTFGHDAGDELLKLVAVRLLNSLRNSDTVSRFGGDEFAVLLESSIDLSHIENVADKICKAFNRPFRICEQDVYITTSIGIAVSKAHNSTPAKLMKQADIALYRAKNDGKNKFHYFTDELDQQSRERMELTKHLRVAIENKEFELAFQPQAHVATGKLCGLEVLLRWQNNELGPVPTERYIPLLEENHLIRDVGAWIAKKSITQFSKWRNEGKIAHDVSLSINISAQQLNDVAVVNCLKKLLAQQQLPAELLVLEITESVLITRPQQVCEILNQLRGLGVKIALDDFGTGFSSLTYLQQFPIDQIKIDKSFVKHILKDENDAKISKAIIDLSKSLGLQVVAEGVEEQQSLELLRDLGCDQYQGYYLARPMLASQLFETLNLIT